MPKQRRKRHIFRNIILLLILAFLILTGYMTYQKLPALSLIASLGQAISATDFQAVSECFQPDSQEREALAMLGKASSLPVLSQLAAGLSGIAGAFLDYEIDYTNIHVTMDGEKASAVIGLTAKGGGPIKAYVNLGLIKTNQEWYAEALPSITKAEDMTSEKKSFWYYMNQLTDYTALTTYGIMLKTS